MSLFSKKTPIHPFNGNVVYISGPHGSGKSTLVTRLHEDKETAERFVVQDQLAHLESLQEMVERAVWRASLHCIEHRLNLAKAEANPKQIIIGDRCYLDDLVYWDAFLELGWLTKEQHRDFNKLTEQVYLLSGTPKPAKIILLVPPYEWNAERVRQRWAEGEQVKWNEGNFTYLRHVNEAFRSRARKVQEWWGQTSYLVMPETDIDQRVTKIKRWLLPRAPLREGYALVEAGRETYRNLGGSD